MKIISPLSIEVPKLTVWATPNVEISIIGIIPDQSAADPAANLVRKGKDAGAGHRVGRDAPMVVEHNIKVLMVVCIHDLVRLEDLGAGLGLGSVQHGTLQVRSPLFTHFSSVCQVCHIRRLLK